jgi:hypothetical protein
LPKIQSLVDIDATPDEVYEVITNTGYTLKTFRDAVSVRVDPPGRCVVGQKWHLVGRAGKRKCDVNREVTELIPGRKMVRTQAPGGIFNSFWQATLLEPRGGKTVAKMACEYELSLGYLGGALNVPLMQNLIRENLTAYGDTVKELSELLPLPTPVSQ